MSDTRYVASTPIEEPLCRDCRYFSGITHAGSGMCKPPNSVTQRMCNPWERSENFPCFKSKR